MNQRHKDGNWSLPTTADGKIQTWEHVQIAVLMDIRDELKSLNAVLHCPNFLAIPSKLDTIAKNTRKKRKPRVVGKPKLRVVTR